MIIARNRVVAVAVAASVATGRPVLAPALKGHALGATIARHATTASPSLHPGRLAGAPVVAQQPLPPTALVRVLAPCIAPHYAAIPLAAELAPPVRLHVALTLIARPRARLEVAAGRCRSGRFRRAVALRVGDELPVGEPSTPDGPRLLGVAVPAEVAATTPRPGFPGVALDAAIDLEPLRELKVGVVELVHDQKLVALARRDPGLDEPLERSRVRNGPRRKPVPGEQGLTVALTQHHTDLARLAARSPSGPLQKLGRARLQPSARPEGQPRDADVAVCFTRVVAPIAHGARGVVVRERTSRNTPLRGRAPGHRQTAPPAHSSSSAETQREYARRAL
eukprot:475335-Prorocentrum_minimum.AAC.2